MKKKSEASQAARLLGKRSWKARLAKYTLDELKQQLSDAGKKATGRPRLPDEQVTLGALYQRARRERLRGREQGKKGGPKNAKNN